MGRRPREEREEFNTTKERKQEREREEGETNGQHIEGVKRKGELKAGPKRERRQKEEEEVSAGRMSPPPYSTPQQGVRGGAVSISRVGQRFRGRQREGKDGRKT